jgi:hypothetical protein
MSSGEDDLTHRILEGTAYDRAEVTVRRTVPLDIVGKIRVSVGVLAASGLLAPALYLSRGRIRAVEGTGALSETLSLTLVTLTLLGVVTAFGASLLLVRQLYTVHRRSLSDDEARRLVRTEDLLMWFVLQGGAFVLIPVSVAVLGVLSGDIIDTLYSYEITVYQPSETVGLDARFVSALGGSLAVLLYALYHRLRTQML